MTDPRNCPTCGSDQLDMPNVGNYTRYGWLNDSEHGTETCRDDCHKGHDAAPPVQPAATQVPASIVGNILDHWEMLPNDTKQDLKDQETGFYNAMERLTDWIEENR